MRILLLALYTAVLAGLVVALPASATNLALPLREHVVTGPVPFGDALVWVSQRDGASYVRERSPDGGIHTVLTVPAIPHAVPWISLARTNEQVGIRAVARQQGELISDTSWWAAPGRPFAQVPPCTLAVGNDYLLSSSPTGKRFLRDPCDTPADPVPRRATDLARVDSDLLDVADGLALDRRRLTWLARPCAISWIIAWDHAAAPRGPSGACGIPRLRTPRALTIRRSTIPAIAMRVRLTCPRASDGCVGRLWWAVSTNRTSLDRAQHSFTLLPGQSRSLTPHHSYRGHAGRPLTVDITGELEGANARSLTRTIPVRRR